MSDILVLAFLLMVFVFVIFLATKLL